MPESAVQPTGASDRIAVLDALRGFALLGIFLANLASFFGVYELGAYESGQLTAPDRAVLFAIDWFVEGKFYTLFSILFGLGFALQAERLSRSGAGFHAFWLRRMFCLLGIGTLHMFLVWNGDILMLYAVLGLFLPLFSNVSTSSLRRLVVALLLAPMLIHVVVIPTEGHAIWTVTADWASELKTRWGYGGRSTLAMRTSSDWAEVFSVNVLQALPRWASYLRSGRYPEVLGMFLVGVLIARTWLPGARTGKLHIPRALWSVGLLGLATSFVYAWLKHATGTFFAATALGWFQGLMYHVGAICLGLGIAGAFVTLWSNDAWRAWLSHFAVLGRMAMTNYILQNIVAVLLFYGYGLAWMAALPFAMIPVVAVLILFAQWWFSRAWLARHQQGPLEHIWRRASYGFFRRPAIEG